MLTKPFYSRPCVNLVVKGYLERESVIQTKYRLGILVHAFNHRQVYPSELKASLVYVLSFRTVKATERERECVSQKN